MIAPELKPTDGRWANATFLAYFESHKAIPLPPKKRQAERDNLRGAYRRRRAFVCWAEGWTVELFDEVAGARVAELASAYPELRWSKRTEALAYSYASHAAVVSSQKALSSPANDSEAA